MKKTILSFCLILFSIFSCFHLLAQNTIELNTKKGNTIITSKDSFNGFETSFSFNEINSVTITDTDKGLFSAISIPGAYADGSIGTPELPAIKKMVALPIGATPKVVIKSYSTTEYNLSDYNIEKIFPVQPPVSKSQDIEDIVFMYNEDAYSINEYNEMPIAVCEEMGTMRGMRLGMLFVYPVRYNPVSHSIIVYNDIDVEVTFENADYTATQTSYRNAYSPYFDQYRQMTMNRGVYEDHPDLYGTPVHMLVIANRMFEETLQPWIEWKTQKGFYMDVNYTDVIGTMSDDIKTFCHTKYNDGLSSGTAPTFIVIAGDVQQVVASKNGSYTSKQTDLYYAAVDNDYYPEMYYSRMSAQTTQQLENIIEKIIYYEKYQFADPTFLDNVLLIAGYDYSWNPRVGQPQINYATTNYYNAAHGFTNVYKFLTRPYNSPYANIGNVGFVNYTAHCNETIWDEPRFNISNVNALTNENKYFIAVGNCCLAADFGYGECIGEAFIRGKEKGAVGYIGSSPNSYWGDDFHFAVGAYSGNINTVTTPTLQNTKDGFYDLSFRDADFNCLSAMVFGGNLSVTYAHVTPGHTVHTSSPWYYWEAYNVLGDGSLMPFLSQGSTNSVTHNNTINQGATSFQVSAVAGSYVAISQNGTLLGTGTVESSGSVDVSLSSPVNSGSVMIVVTRQQYKPYIQTISVSSGGTNYVISATVNPTNSGTITGAGTYASGATATLTASANSGYNFVNWTENGSQISTNASYSFTVTGNRNLVANFEAQTTNYTISVSANPTNAGTVTGGGSYAAGATATVTASANSGYNFVNWTENGSQVSTNASYSFTVNGNRNLVANFETQTVNYNISVSANPTNAGTVTGGGSYAAGTTATVTASANSGYNFKNWTENGSQVSTNASYSFTVNGNRNLVANFETQTVNYNISASVNPANSGSVTGDGTYPAGATATLVATANQGYEFNKWTENGNTVYSNPSYSFIVTKNRNLVANFTVQSFTITAGASPEAGGQVTGDGTFNYGATVTLKATANTGYTFISWTENGNTVSTDATYSFIAEENRNLTAIFEINIYSVNIIVSPEESGTVSGAGEYTHNQSVTLNATPAENHIFENWMVDNSIVETNPEYSFNISQNITITANFKSSVGIENIYDNTLIYPNPTDSHITIECENMRNIQLYDLQARIIKQITLQGNKYSMDISDLESGIYMLRIVTDSEVKNYNIIKK